MLLLSMMASKNLFRIRSYTSLVVAWSSVHELVVLEEIAGQFRRPPRHLILKNLIGNNKKMHYSTTMSRSMLANAFEESRHCRRLDFWNCSLAVHYAAANARAETVTQVLRHFIVIQAGPLRSAWDLCTMPV